MRGLSVRELIERLSDCPAEMPVRLSQGGVDLPACEVEVIQGGWEPPFVRVAASGGAGEDALAERRPLLTVNLGLLLVAVLGFIVGYFVGRGF